MTSRRRGPLLAAVAAVGISGLCATAAAPVALASAAPGLAGRGPGFAAAGSQEKPASFEDGLWWYRSLRVPQLHRAGATGKGVTVGVVDGPVYPAPELAGSIESSRGYCTNAGGAAGRSKSADASHATEMSVLITGNGHGTYHGRGVYGIAPEAKVRTYSIAGSLSGDAGSFSCDQGGSDHVVFVHALDQAVKDRVKIVNLSIGDFLSVYDDVAAAVVRAERAGVILVAAGGNSPHDIGWPNYANGVVTVNAVDRKAHLPSWAPKGKPGAEVATAAPGVALTQGHLASDGSGWHSDGWASGSSGATALTSGGLAAVWSKFPTATGNQILQLMVHSMGLRVQQGGGGPAYFTSFARSGGPIPVGSTGTGFGWGVFDPADMVKGNPLSYPDVNPLLRSGNTVLPTTAQLTKPGATSSASSSTTSSAAATTASGGASSSSGAASSSLASLQVAGAAAVDRGSGSAPVLWAAGAAALLALGAVVLARRRTTGTRRMHQPQGS